LIPGVWASIIQPRDTSYRLGDLSVHGFNGTIPNNNEAARNCIATKIQLPTIANIFRPIENGAPSVPVSNAGHAVPPRGLKNRPSAIQTNKFYANILLGNQKQPVYAMPYSIVWSGCSKTNKCHHGVGISQIDEDQVMYGPGSPVNYFYNPTHLQAIVLSERNFGPDTSLTSEKATPWSITMALSPRANQEPLMKLPLIQGMGFVTAKYRNAAPVIGSLVGLKGFSLQESRPNERMAKYRMNLDDSSQWVMYVFSNSAKQPNFVRQADNTYLDVNGGFSGIIQIAKLPKDAASAAVYDRAAGTYAMDATIEGSVGGDSGWYSMAWKTESVTRRDLLMFALPHHIESMSSDTRARLTSLRLRTTTKGVATAILTNRMTLMEQNLPVNVGFYPWSAERQASKTCLNNASRRRYISDVTRQEINSDIVGRVAKEPSVYFAGKV
jgi:endo-1,3(4)-beta-glucanase